MTELNITSVMNGWIVKCKYDVDESRTYVFSHDDREGSDVKAFVQLLWQINECIGPSTSRYSAERVSISVRAGDKYGD